MKNKLILAICLMFVLTGCSYVNISSIRMPGTEMQTLKKFYVKKRSTDKRGIDLMIRDQLIAMGFEAVTGKVNYEPEEFDAIVTYTDRWMWDMANYLLQLTIYIKNTDTGYIGSAGKSFRTSLDRKPPEYMAKEILEEVFKNKKLVQES